MALTTKVEPDYLKKELEKYRYAQISQAKVGGEVRGGPVSFAPADSHPSFEQMIAMRLHVPQGGMIPFDYLRCHRHRDNQRVSVFVVVDDKSLIIEDQWDLFPSDTLITQLRILKG